MVFKVNGKPINNPWIIRCIWIPMGFSQIAMAGFGIWATIVSLKLKTTADDYHKYVSDGSFVDRCYHEVCGDLSIKLDSGFLGVLFAVTISMICLGYMSIMFWLGFIAAYHNGKVTLRWNLRLHCASLLFWSLPPYPIVRTSVIYPDLLTFKANSILTLLIWVCNLLSVIYASFLYRRFRNGAYDDVADFDPSSASSGQAETATYARDIESQPNKKRTSSIATTARPLLDAISMRSIAPTDTSQIDAISNRSNAPIVTSI